MTKGKKVSKGQIQEVINNKKQSAGAMGQDVINQIAAAAERTRVSILESVTAEIQALEAALKGAVAVGAPEIPASFLTAIAAVKADVTKKAWLGFFGVYHQYGIVPRAEQPAPVLVPTPAPGSIPASGGVPAPEEVPKVEVKTELDVPKGPDAPDADEFAKETAEQIAEVVAEKAANEAIDAAEEQATIDLAAEREKLRKEREEKH